MESRVSSDESRRLLFEMDTHLMRPRTHVGETDPAVIGLTGTRTTTSCAGGTEVWSGMGPIFSALKEPT